MLSDQDTQQQPADWFLIASRGDLVLRLAQDLQVGEDGTGGIVLSPAREHALLGISIQGNELTLKALALNWTFGESGYTRQHITFPAGTSIRLNFPHSWVMITPNFLAGARARPDRILDLKPMAPPAVALTRLAEPITLVERAAVATEPHPLIGVATTEEVAALLEANLDEMSERLLRGHHDVPDEAAQAAEEVPAANPEPSAGVTEPLSAGGPVTASGVMSATGTSALIRKPRHRRRRMRHAPLAAAIIAVALLAPMAMLLEEPGMLGMSALEPAIAPPGSATDPIELTDEGGPAPEMAPAPAGEPVASETAPIVEPAALEPAPVETAAAGTADESGEMRVPFEEPLPQAEPDPEATDVLADSTVSGSEPVRAATDTSIADSPAVPDEAPAAVPAGQVLTDEEAARVATLVAEAQALLDTGAIVTPVHDNAVGRLIEVLTLDPTNEEGLRLMYQSAVRLVEQAEAAHAAGDDYLARNLLEDVLGFHPEFEMARKLQHDWLEEEDLAVKGNG